MRLKRYRIEYDYIYTRKSRMKITMKNTRHVGRQSRKNCRGNERNECIYKYDMGINCRILVRHSPPNLETCRAVKKAVN